MATATRFDRGEMQRRVRHPLQALTRYIRRYVTLEGLAIAILYLAVWFWIGVALDYGAFKIFGGFDWIQELQALSENNTDLVLRITLLVLLVAGLLAVVATKVLLRLMREFRDRALALVLERRFPRELGDRLITAVEMADTKMSEQYGYSQQLVDTTIRDAADRVERLPVSGVFNWRRLRRLWLLAAAGTLGVYLLVGAVYTTVVMIVEEAASPMSYVWRFNDVASIWAERNVLLMNSYWPRRAHLEVIRFQDTPSHPDEMRVGRDEQRPDVQVRAVQWVIADRKARNGWRALRWSDLPQLLTPPEIDRVAIPKDFDAWIVDLDDISRDVADGVFPADWQGKTTGYVRASVQRQGAEPAYLATPEARNAYNSLLDWTTWTVDKIELQVQKQPVRLALRQDEAAFAALENVFTSLNALAGSPSMSRRLRKLVVPDLVQVYYRGQTTKSDREHEKGQDSKFSVGLNDLKESVRFTVRGEDYYTPYRKITLVPPPSIVHMSVDKWEPAYLFYRVQGDQKQLKGERQEFTGVPVGVMGEISIIQVPLGTDLVLTAKADRQVKGGVRMRAPATGDDRGAVLPAADVQVKADGQSFTTEFKNVKKNIDFIFEWADEDNVRGKRRVQIKPIDDRAPEVFDVEMTVVLRKPRFRAEPGKAAQGNPADGFLITPDAALPFKGTLRDDYGLTAASWVHEVEPVEIELVGAGLGKDRDRLPTLVMQGSSKVRRSALIASGLQILPTNPGMELYGAAYWTLIGKIIDFDLAMAAKRQEGEERLALDAFRRRLDQSDDLPLNAILQKLKEKPPTRPLFKEHFLKDEDGFDFRRHLSRLKGSSKEGQLHFLVRLSVEAVDNNVETGPSTGRNKAPFSFLVVSEAELLTQIGIEEEALYERLEKVYFKLNNAKTSLSEQVAKLTSPAADLSLVAIRVDEIRKALSDSASTSREVSADYGRILRELEVNRVKKDKIDLVENKIVRPLEDIVNPNFGNFSITEEFANRLHLGLEEDLAAKMDRQDAHLKNARDTAEHLDRLLVRLKEVLDGMDEGVTFNKLLEIIVRLEQDQRNNFNILIRYQEQRTKEILEEALKLK